MLLIHAKYLDEDFRLVQGDIEIEDGKILRVGKDLPRMVWVIAAADALDAMSSNRCYRKRCDLDYILSEFERGRGTQFSPEVADAVIDLLKTGGIPLA